MKILIDHRESGYFYGGAENHIRELSKKLLERGHEIFILTEKGKDDPLNELKKFPNFHVKYLRSMELRRNDQFKSLSSNFSKQIKKKIFLTHLSRIISNLPWMIKSSLWMISHKKEFDVVWVLKYTDAFTLRIINKLKKIPFVESLEGYDYIEAEHAKKVKFVYTISNFIIEECKKVHGFSPEYITIGVDREKFQKVPKRAIDFIHKKYGKRIILNVGRLVESKDMPSFIRAAFEVIKEFPNVIFLICGDGVEKSNLINLIKELHLEKNVFIPEINGEKDLLNYYGSAEIFAHVPKIGNHFGIVYIEAMAAGLPIIAANEDASPKTVEGCAILVSPQDISGISEAIKKLLKDKKLREKFSKNSIERAESLYNWDKITSQMENIFERSISSFIKRQSR